MFLFAACVNVPRSNLDAKDGVAVDVVAVANARVCQDQIKAAAGAPTLKTQLFYGLHSKWSQSHTKIATLNVAYGSTKAQ